MRLQGQVAIVTGATKGIGRIIAATLATEGAKVVVTGRTAERGAQVVAGIRSDGGDATFIRADVGDETSTQAVIDETISTYGSLTTVVNNAAPTELLRRVANVGDVALEDWDAVLRVALTGAMLMSKHAIPHLIAAGGGTIINISSDAGVRSTLGFSPYCAAKAGLNALTRSIALEYAPVNIRSNSIQVGQILPPLTVEPISSHPVLGPKLMAAHPLRLGRREDIANTVVFLASDEASFVNGTTIPVDGGASSTSNLLSAELLT